MRTSTVIFAATLATAAFAAPSVHDARSNIGIVAKPVVHAPHPVKLEASVFARQALVPADQSGAFLLPLLRFLPTALGFLTGNNKRELDDIFARSLSGQDLTAEQSGALLALAPFLHLTPPPQTAKTAREDLSEVFARAAADESGAFSLGSLFSGILKTLGLGRREFEEVVAREFTQHLARAATDESGAFDLGSLFSGILKTLGLGRREFDELLAREFSEHVARAAVDESGAFDLGSLFSGILKTLGLGRREFEEALLARETTAIPSTQIHPDLESGAFSLGSLFSGILKTFGLGRREVDELLARGLPSGLTPQQSGALLALAPLLKLHGTGKHGLGGPLPQVRARQLLEKQARSLNDLD